MKNCENNEFQKIMHVIATREDSDKYYDFDPGKYAARKHMVKITLLAVSVLVLAGLAIVIAIVSRQL